MQFYLAQVVFMDGGFSSPVRDTDASYAGSVKVKMQRYKQR
jgi:hypothetical protein